MIGIGLNINNRVIVSGGGYDPDAQAFFDRVATAGGTLTTTEKNATNQLVLDMKSAGIWSAMKAIYPMVGASAAACAQNLVSASFTGTFSSGWTFSSSGVQGNGTSTYINTAFKNSDFTNYNSTSVFYYGNVGTNTASWDTGNINSTPNLRITVPPSETNIYFQFNSANIQAFAYTPRSGFFGMNRISSSQVNVFANNTKLGTVNETIIANTNTNNIVIGSQFSNGSPNNSDRLFKFYSLGDGLTDTQASNFYTAVQTFNQTLNRQVGAQIVSDADAQAYINRVYTAGGTLTNTEANAVNQLVIDMKAAGIWTTMKAVYPMVGASAAACAQNLKSSSFTGTFTSGWTFASTGVTPNGTSAYFNTNFNHNLISQNSGHLSIYNRTDALGLFTDIGADGSTNSCSSIWSRYSNLTYNQIHNANGNYQTVANTNSQGHYISNRTGSTVLNQWKNGSKTGTSTAASVTPSSALIYVGALNGGGVAQFFTSRQYAFASLGDGLTDTQAADFYTCVNSFQVSLSRNV